MTDTSELVEALRKIGGHGFPNWADEAANTIKAQAERIEALEEAIHDADQTLMLLGDTGWRKRHRAALAGGRG